MSNLTASEPTPKFYRSIKTFVHRSKTTKAQQRSLDELFPKYGLTLEQGKLNLPELFSNAKPIFMEIGFGMGDSLFTEATENPEINFIGIEVYTAGVGKILGNIETAKLTNLRIFKQDALDIINNCFVANTFSEIKVLFPDPWQKKRYNKRRIIQPSFAEKIYDLLKPDGKLIVATDWQDYAEHILDVLNNSKLTNLSANNSYTERYARPLTKYENKAIREGRRIFNFEFAKKIN